MSGLFEEILAAPDRDRCPGRRPVLSFRDDDEPEFLSALEACRRTDVSLSRRGIWHGQWAELADDPTGPHPEPPKSALLAQRWHTGRPLLWRTTEKPRHSFDEEIGRKRRLFDELQEPGGLRSFLKEHKRALEEAGFQIHPRPGSVNEEERDIERVRLTWTRDSARKDSLRVKDLWTKSGWLSTFDGDASLRMRLSFGREVVDDASRDHLRHRLVAELGELMFPETALVADDPQLVAFLEQMCGGEVYFTQSIAYWNGPEGGALFHHDAFEEETVGGQRGVVYVQLAGRTAWLALSIEDLARRVIEFGEYLAEGELPWVRDQHFKRPESFDRFQRMLKRFPRVMRELARTDCGSLGRLVNRGPEFTSFLADAGHAFLLEPGDILLLPNHGPRCTAMHSVFGASEDAAYGLSLAVRELRPPPPPELPESEEQSSGRSRGRGPRQGRGKPFK